MTPDQIIEKIRDTSTNQAEIGKNFEEFSTKFLLTDPVWRTQFKRVIPFPEWARENSQRAGDIGIDLVGDLLDESGLTAIQCKCYQPDHRIQIGDLNKFIATASKEPFTEMLFVDTTNGGWGVNAEEQVRGRTNFKRISLEHFRNSSIDWADFAENFQTKKEIKLKTKEIRPHQQEAITNVLAGFKLHDRGKMIMACGTGKTYTSLKIAETIAGKSGRVLMLVPSLALMSQTIREWFSDSEIQLRAIAVCSDTQVGKSPRARRSADKIDADADIDVCDLTIPVTTDFQELISKVPSSDSNRMIVVFSTYQSISAIIDAQKSGLPEFDLIICDEAHRTTGAKIVDEDESNFIRVHDNSQVVGKKRLYMTATPKIFSEQAQKKADASKAFLCSMDNEEQYGPTFHSLNFGSAVAKDLLTDYKVVVLAMDQQIVSRSVQERLKESGELHLDNATKIVGCYRALQKHGDRFSADSSPMRRAIMFCDSIKASKFVSEEFEHVTRAFNNSDFSKIEEFDTSDSKKLQKLNCMVEHVDGTFNAKERDKLLNWLREENKDNSKHECRILSNARCLSEGVDVPDLDSIMFMHPRKSQIDIVQAVGRVMRKAKGKKMGYIILPIVIPAAESAVKSLDDNKKYGIVWGVLNALRAHDDRFDASINKFDINGHFGDRIEVIAEIADIPQKRIEPHIVIGEGVGLDPDKLEQKIARATQLGFEFDEFTAAMHARIVKKCGNRMYWTDWAKNIGAIAQNYIERIKAVLDVGSKERKVFDEFLNEIRDDLNDQITDEEAIEMLGQHFVTKPVFDSLFQEYDFSKLNPVSKAMQKVLNALEPKNLQSEVETLNEFYENVKNIVSDIETLEGRQKIIKVLYEKFFKSAFSKMAQRLGIVYTPNEIVDFIVHSVNDILKREFDQTLGSKGVHIIDPFTGTGTFISQLLQSGLISNDEMEYKFKNEIHANEIALLAYYVAAINIETVYHEVSGNEYTPFTGICLTDTFAMYKNGEDLYSSMLEDNSNRRTRQKNLDIRVIIGNPPYSAGQRRAKDNAQNVKYPELDTDIRTDYVEKGNANLVQNIFDSYIRAIYMANKRIGKNCGITGFVTGNGWLTKSFADGMRLHEEQECSNVYIINLRGEIRQGFANQNSQEGENVFGNESMTGISIVLFVKNPNSKKPRQVFYYDIGDNLKREEKLAKLKDFNSIASLIDKDLFVPITSDKFGDWFAKRESELEKYLYFCDRDQKNQKNILNMRTLGVSTNRNAWCINFDKVELENNIKMLISSFNEVLEFRNSPKFKGNIDELIESNKHIPWSDKLIGFLNKGKRIHFENGDFRLIHYKPFSKQWLYLSNELNDRPSKIPKLYPHSNATNRNIVVCGRGAQTKFNALMCDSVFNLHFNDTGIGFPLLIPENSQKNEMNRLDNLDLSDGYVHNVSDLGLTHFQSAYNCPDISKDDLFYYVYGIFHSELYISRFQNSLKRGIHLIPPTKNINDFWKFVEAGRQLGDLHVNYDKSELFQAEFPKGSLQVPKNCNPTSYFQVKKMKLENNETEIKYNDNITITGIPLEAYDYEVNGKSAIRWVLNEQENTIDTDSNIKNDANVFANDTMNDPAYPLKLLLRVITVSLETTKIVKSLPQLDFD